MNYSQIHSSVRGALFLIISTYVGFNSIPIQFLPNPRATFIVVPEPRNRSNTIPFGRQLERIGLIWEKATPEEKHKLLAGMLEAVYVDLAASRSIVGIQPKPLSYPLFESPRHKPENKVIVFSPGEEGKNGLRYELRARF